MSLSRAKPPTSIACMWLVLRMVDSPLIMKRVSVGYDLNQVYKPTNHHGFDQLRNRGGAM